MNEPTKIPIHIEASLVPRVASELNNLIQIISGTHRVLEDIWQGTEVSEKYFAILRVSIGRAQQITAQLAAKAGGANGKVGPAPEPEKITAAVLPPPPPPPKHTILVVDDEQMVLSLLGQVLTEGGYQPVCVQSGFECLDLLRRNPTGYDLVLLDLAMPLMDGEETFEQLRRISATVKVVLTTGFCQKERLERMISAGLNGYLGKPFRNEELLLMIASIIERAKKEPSNSSSEAIAFGAMSHV
jgi:CheY-like chemotaxis protein